MIGELHFVIIANNSQQTAVLGQCKNSDVMTAAHLVNGTVLAIISQRKELLYVCKKCH